MLDERCHRYRALVLLLVGLENLVRCWTRIWVCRICSHPRAMSSVRVTTLRVPQWLACAERPTEATTQRRPFALRVRRPGRERVKRSVSVTVTPGL